MVDVLNLVSDPLAGSIAGSVAAAITRWQQLILERARAGNISPPSPTPIELCAVEILRGLIRPMLTAFLVCTTVLLAFKLVEYHTLYPEQVGELLAKLVDCIVNCTSFALSWWFSARSVK